MARTGASAACTLPMTRRANTELTPPHASRRSWRFTCRKARTLCLRHSTG